MPLLFTRTIENFTCDHCAYAVVGNGYTNHCPDCLWSKHVDNSPGDRASECCAMMKPSIEKVNGSSYTLKHTCLKCGHTKINKSAKDDSVEEIIKLSVTKKIK